MDDSDDYFDDLVLDEGAIAVLDKVETQFGIAQPLKVSAGHAPRRPATRGPEPPHAKGQKIIPLKRERSANDYEELPEISVQGDNYYQVVAGPTIPTNGVVYRPSDSQPPRVARPLQGRSLSSASIGRSVAPHPSQQLTRRPTGPTISSHNAQKRPRALERLPSSNHTFGLQGAPQGTQSGDAGQKAKRDAEILRVKMEEVCACIQLFLSPASSPS